jgi:hypothetical protein
MSKKVLQFPKRKMDIEKVMFRIWDWLKSSGPVLREKILERLLPVIERFFPVPEETKQLNIPIDGLSDEQIGEIEREIDRFVEIFRERYRGMLVEICVLTAEVVRYEEDATKGK